MLASVTLIVKRDWVDEWVVGGLRLVACAMASAKLLG